MIIRRDWGTGTCNESDKELESAWEAVVPRVGLGSPQALLRRQCDNWGAGAQCHPVAVLQNLIPRPASQRRPKFASWGGVPENSALSLDTRSRVPFLAWVAKGA